MKARIKFRKYGILKYIGHLDVMRFFQKAMRRAEIPIAFSSGYSPHMIMSFAQPLGLGMTSQGEYLDIELQKAVSSQEAVERLNRVMAEGIDVMSFRQIQEEKKHSGMSILAAADYLAVPKEFEHTVLTEPDRSQLLFPPGWEAYAASFLARDQITVLKKTKRSEKEVDIRPMIYDFHMEPAGMCLRLAAGSEANLKPELAAEAFLSSIHEEGFPLHYHRKELYARNPQEGKPPFVSLESLGRDIFIA